MRAFTFNWALSHYFTRQRIVVDLKMSKHTDFWGHLHIHEFRRSVVGSIHSRNFPQYMNGAFYIKSLEQRLDEASPE